MPSGEERVLEGVIAAFADDAYRVTLHTWDRISDRDLALPDVIAGVCADAPEIIEDYPEHRRGPCCLILCQGPSGKMYHVLVTHPPRIWLITVYEPDPGRWSADLRRRRR